ncbi:MAG: L,D-transpeptidase family protein [Cyclobacteriaceae bacterium]|nr:L,D-transpeptidase family protein [Cyclobacteriaceae bacterium]
MASIVRYAIRRVRFPFLIGIALLLISSGCQQKVVVPSVSEVTEEATAAPRIATGIQDSIFLGLTNPELVIQYYQQTDFRASWVEGQRTSTSCDSLLGFIQQARYYGLAPKDYHIDELLDATTSRSRTDVLLTDAFLSLAHDLRYGTRNPVKSVKEDSIRLKALVQSRGSEQAVEYLRLCQPPYSGYRELRLALRHVIDSLEPSQRLSVLQHKDTTARIAHIEANLDRWRQERLSFHGRYILVNVPSFMLYVMQDDNVVLASRIIVGETQTPTPELSSRITRLVTYPYWHVPRKIAVKEYLPAIQQDTSILKRNNFDVLDRQGRLLNPDSVPWSSYTPDYFPVSLRQREGRENALGVIKFEFSNPYAVFLHDTNARKLFQQSVRAFSHGCIRMEKAEALAHYLVTGNLNEKSKKLTELLMKQEKHVLRLSEPIPIYVRYFTAEVRGGKLMIYPDLYQKDGDEAF